VASLSASADVLALASAEFDLGDIEEGKTIIGWSVLNNKNRMNIMFGGWLV